MNSEQNYKEILRDIRQQCLRMMNGVTSTSMRQKGLAYKVNFGLSVPQIKTLSERYQSNKGLAETLWKENTRELKILAILLYPIDTFTKDTAELWVKEIPNQEIREQLCFNLLQHLPYAQEISEKWSNADSETVRTSGYWLLSRILISRKNIDLVSVTSLKRVNKDVISDDMFLRNASLLVLKQLGRQRKSDAMQILNNLSDFKDCGDPIKEEVYNSLNFEFDFYYED